jgi:hypothetical protein
MLSREHQKVIHSHILLTREHLSHLGRGLPYPLLALKKGYTLCLLDSKAGGEGVGYT